MLQGIAGGCRCQQRLPDRAEFTRRAFHVSDTPSCNAVRPSFLLLLMLLAGPLAAAETLRVELIGLEGELHENVWRTLGIVAYQQSDTIQPGRVHLLHANAEEEIRRALQPFGYYRPQVNAELSFDNEQWLARYRVEHGPRVRLDTVEIRLSGAGQNDPAFEHRLETLHLKSGDPLLHARYEAAISALQELALERGYFDATFLRREVRVRIAQSEADVHVHFDTGQRYRFGTTRFAQTQEILAPEFLQRYVQWAPGDAYVAGDLLSLQSALLDSNYFSSARVSPQPAAAEDLQIPIDVDLTPRKPNQYLFGIGYGTDTGTRGRFGWERRWVNRRGHRVHLDTELSEIKDAVTARYVVPLRNPRSERLTYLAGLDAEDTDTSQSDIALVGATYAHARGRWTETLGLTYEVEDFTVGGTPGRSHLLLPRISWSRTRADDRIFARRGDHLSLDVRGASEALLSDANLVQAVLGAKWVRGLGARNRLLLRGNAGYTWVSEFVNLPPSLRFFAGGDRSVRGYDYVSLGPRDTDGRVIGGKYLLVGSIEYDHYVRDNFGFAVFYDAGNALDDLSLPLKHGAGVGLRWRSPIGLIRVDFASALSNDGNPWRLHLVVGPDL